MPEHPQEPAEEQRGDAGVGLAELLVSMGLFSIAITLVAAVVAGSLATVRFTSTKTETTADARLAMEVVSRALRVAVVPRGEPLALVSAAADAVTFYASLERSPGETADRPTLVTYAHGELDGRLCLVETRVPASDNPGSDAPDRPFVWTGAGTSTCLAETATPPAFTYYDTGRLTDPATGAATAPLVVTGAGLEPSQIRDVVSVEVELSALHAGTDVPPVLVRDRVTLMNIADPSGGS